MGLYRTRRETNKDTMKCPFCNGESVVCSCGSKLEKNWGITLSYVCVKSRTTAGISDTHSIIRCPNQCDNGRVPKTKKNG